MTDAERIWSLIGFTLFAVMFYLLQPILTPFLVAAALAYLGDPLADRMETAGLSRTWAVILVFTGLSIIFTLAVILSVPLIGRQLDLLASNIPELLESLQHNLIPWIQQRLGLPADSLPLAEFKTVLSENWMTAGEVLTTFWQQLAGSSLAMVGFMANLVLIPVVTFYLLRDWDVLMAHLRDLLPRSKEQQVVALVQECDEILGAFIRGQLLVMLALGIVYAVGLWLVGLELALLLGLLAGLASIVPYMGFIVGIAAASVAAWFQFNEFTMLIWVAGVFGVGQMLEGMVLTPLLVGDRIGLHPVAVIFAVLAGGQLAGFAGVLLALPVAAVVMVFLRHAHSSYKQSQMYGAQQTDETEALTDITDTLPDNSGS